MVVGEVLFKQQGHYQTLQWRHMNVMASQITDTDCLFDNFYRLGTKKHETPDYSPFVKENQHWPMNSRIKGQ